MFVLIACVSMTSGLKLILEDDLEGAPLAGQITFQSIAEYIVWRIEDAEIDWFVLEEGQCIKMKPDRHGKLRSRIFPGLACDKAKVLAALKM